MIALAGSATDDGLPNPPGALTATWSQVSGPGAVWFGNANQPNTMVGFPGIGTYVLRLSANDGALQASDDLTVTIQRSPSPVTFVTKGSIWKYLDDGSDQGASAIDGFYNRWLHGRREDDRERCREARPRRWPDQDPGCQRTARRGG